MNTPVIEKENRAQEPPSPHPSQDEGAGGASQLCPGCSPHPALRAGTASIPPPHSCHEDRLQL